MQITRTITAALVGSAVLLGSAGVAAAQETPSETRPTPVVCEKLQHFRDRITADADTVGSVAWLNARADQAEAEGHERIAEVLRHRADRREARIEIVDRRLARCE